MWHNMPREASKHTHTHTQDTCASQTHRFARWLPLNGRKRQQCSNQLVASTWSVPPSPWWPDSTLSLRRHSEYSAVDGAIKHKILNTTPHTSVSTLDTLNRGSALTHNEQKVTEKHALAHNKSLTIWKTWTHLMKPYWVTRRFLNATQIPQK